ncbi:PREDICTED: ankyrin [Prunus dulcis]|uniref:PREDICTED: ankyrin n=1 Tax=Prunus dulcis TaxID=3755 RepID=A0A5E4GGQ3_PRUDU|nr:PREDICTED: ankyrin [Prunus dulcis]
MDASNSTNQTKSTSQLALAGQADETNQEACLISGMDLDVYKAAKRSLSLIEPKQVAHKSSNIVEKILEMCPELLWQSNGSGETILHIAARHGCSDIVPVLVKAAKSCHGDLGQVVKEA